MTLDISKILTSPAVRTPFPIAVNGVPVTGGDAGECEICVKKCATRDCLGDLVIGQRICHLGVRYYKFNIGGLDLTVYGLAPLVEGTGRAIRSLKGRKFPDGLVHQWARDVATLLQLLDSAADAARAEALDSIHDISRIATEVASLANDLTRPAMDANGGFGSAPAIHVSILKVSELLLKEFDRLELLINPASAATGRIYSHIYKLCHKYMQIIDLAYCKGNNKKIVMMGRSQIELRVYESISVLVFALIENAAKYSVSGERIEVELADGVGYVDVAVRSTGPLIEPEEIARIFDRGFRGKWAIKSDSDGRGMGLHLAKIVADAHQARIVVGSRSLGYERNSIPCAHNIFSVRLSAV